MSSDTVDDLHAAEEHAEHLRTMIRRVVDARRALGSARTAEYPAAEREFIEAFAEMDVLSEDRWVRPTCEVDEETGGCTEGEDCGGYHPWLDEDAADYSRYQEQIATGGAS
jgi:predicted RNA-binding Zn ribbon-like protein